VAPALRITAAAYPPRRAGPGQLGLSPSRPKQVSHWLLPWE